MRPCLSGLLLLALVFAGPVEMSAQSSVALTERIAASITKQEPAWRLVEAFAPPQGPTFNPVAIGRWAAESSLSIAITVFDSPADASEGLTLRDSGRSVGPSSEAVDNYGHRALRRDNEIAFQKFNLLIAVRGSTATIHRASVLVDAVIVRHLVITECVDELLPRHQPTSQDINAQLFRAAESGCIADLQSGLEGGADANARYDNESVLFAAIRRQHVEAVHLLLKGDADPNIGEATSGTTALWAVLRAPTVCCSKNRSRARIQADRLAIVDALVAAGADINARRANGRTVLLDAMRDLYWNDGEFLGGLLARGAAAQLRDNAGDTALTLLISNTSHSQLKDDKRIQLLIAAGADVNAKGVRGKTVLELVREKSRQYQYDLSSVTQILVAAGAK